MEPRPDSLFSADELYYDMLEAPVLIPGEQTIKPEYEVEYSGSLRIKVWGRERWFNLSDEGLRKIRHEMVSTVMGPETDIELREIGVTGPDAKLTPDFIIKHSNVVLEIGTSGGFDESSLQTMYKGKFIKYQKLVESVGYSLAVIIVGKSGVYTNVKMTQKAANALYLRFKIGYALEAKITDLIGENIFSEDWSALENHCKNVMSEIKGFPQSTDLFDVETIVDCAKPPSKLEFGQVGQILKKALNESSKKSPETQADLQKYIQNFDEDAKTSLRRITNIPMVVCDMSNPSEIFLDVESSTMPAWMKTVWSKGREVGVEKMTLEQQIEEALLRKEYVKHRTQKSAAFNVKLDDEEKLEAAKCGLWAKSLKENPEIQKKDAESHRSFHPLNTDTSDIEKFMAQDLLSEKKTQIAIPKEIWKLIQRAKDITGKNSLSMSVIDNITRSKFCHFGQMISELFTEICYTYKYWIKRSDFYHKVHKGVHMLIRCTGDHTFVSFAFPKKFTDVIDTGRIGPVLYESNDYYFTKFSSYNEPTVEHFVKAGPYLTSIYCHLLSHFEISLNSVDSHNEELSRTLNGVTLLYLNNKTDAEELVTNQRYLTMGILEEIDPNPYRFVDRLPDVYRSRLTCYLAKSTIHHMNVYAGDRIVKSKSGIEEDELIEHEGILSLFTNRRISLKQKINEFYFGYVISKERGRGSDRNFKIMKKIVAEEHRFRDTVVKTMEKTFDPKVHVSNPTVIKVFLALFRKQMEQKYGKDWNMVLTKAIYSNWARKSFYEIATMKVASRTYYDRIVVPTMDPEESTSNIRRILEGANPNETKRRPRVMEAIKMLIDDYVACGNNEPKHPVDLLPYCLELIKRKGYFDSDIFPKPQHGGDREIHVLEITMRVVQLFTESCGRTLCEFISSDSLTHPKSKEYFVKNHYKSANDQLPGSFITLGKSADATKWCQRHHSSKFAAILVGSLPYEFWPLILNVMYLWQFKRISFPIQFAANFMSNTKTKSNKTYERMRNEFFTGTGIFKEAYNSKMWIQSGMMQGILHYISSATHGIIQEVMKQIQARYLSDRKIKSVITVIQGSDDSAQLISLSGKKPSELVRIGTTMLHWKENISKYFSIYTSRAKSAIGSLDLIEYNSEWFIRSSVCKPTFRWVSSCLETGIVEKFVDRYQNMQGTLTTVLEGGGKLLEVAMIQICQAWMHYMLLGLHTSDLSELAAWYLLGIKDPSLGFFPMDSDFTAGITGFNYAMYQLYTKTNYGAGLGRTVLKDVEIDFFEDDNKDPAISKDLRKVRIKFGDHKIFTRILRDMSIPELEEIIKVVEQDPSLLYFPSHEWATSKFRIFLKVFEPGVKESLSRHSATARMMSASAYMLSRPCIFHPLAKGKVSLLWVLTMEFHKEAKPKLDADQVFMHAAEYKQLTRYIDSLESNRILKTQTIKTRSKQKIVIFDVEDSGPTLIDMCRWFWFGRGHVPLSSRQKAAKWLEMKKRYSFLNDSREITKQNLRMNDVQLKNFLESQSEKTRSITLMDTAARASSVESCITRIFWANTKVLQSKSEFDEDDSSFALRSRLFSIMTSFLPYTEIKKEVLYTITTAPILKTVNVPQRVAKLKCIHDYLTTGNKFGVVQRVIDQKLGSVGFFTVRQQGWGAGRSGYGEWKGKVLDSSVKIEMEGNTCIAIHVSNLNRVSELGTMLNQLVQGFSLKPSEVQTNSEHWLGPSGRITYGMGRKSGIPVIISPHLRVDIVDRLTDYNWIWDVAGNRVRLIAVVDRDTKITILSEGLHSSDWDPYHGLPGNSEMALWSRGERISIDALRNEFSPYFGLTRRELLAAIRTKQATRLTMNGWSVQKTINLIQYFYPRLNTAQATPESETESEIDLAELEDMMAMVNLEEGDMDIDFTEEEMTAEMFEMDEIDVAELEAQLEILLQHADPSTVLRLDRSKMPISNQFFYNLNVLSRAQTGMSLSELWTDFSSNEHKTTHDILGLILSFMTNRICLHMAPTDDDDANTIEQESISLITSIKSELEVDELDEEELKQMIVAQEEYIARAPVRMKPKLEMSLKRYKNALKLISIPINTSTDLDAISSKEVLQRIMPEIPQMNFSTNPKLADIQIRRFIDNKLDNLVERAEISQHEHAVYREAVSKTYCTPMIVDAIALSINKTVRLNDYVSGDGDVDIDLQIRLT